MFFVTLDSFPVFSSRQRAVASRGSTGFGFQNPAHGILFSTAYKHLLQFPPLEMLRHSSKWRPSWLLWISLSAQLSNIASVSAQLTGNGLSVILDDINYFISPFITGYIASSSLDSSTIGTIYGFAPITVVQEAATTENLADLFSNWSTSDDVFQSGFTGAVFLNEGAHFYKLQRAVTNTTNYRVLQLNSTIPSGPYFVEISTGALHQVYRLYDDFAGSFTTPLLQTPEGSFRPLSAQVAASATMTIGVPSRLYFTKTADKPLAGVRVSVKVCCVMIQPLLPASLVTRIWAMSTAIYGAGLYVLTYGESKRTSITWQE